MRRDAALGGGAVGAGVGDGEEERRLQRLGDGLEHAGLGAAGVGAGHHGEQAVAVGGEAGGVRRRALAAGAADRHLEGGKFVVADALEAGEARVAQLPAAAAVGVGADLDGGEGVLQRARHPLCGAVVGVELLGDLGQ